MPVQLLDSQFTTLEPLNVDETAFVVDIDQEFETVVAKMANYIRTWPLRFGARGALAPVASGKNKSFCQNGLPVWDDLRRRLIAHRYRESHQFRGQALACSVLIAGDMIIVEWPH